MHTCLYGAPVAKGPIGFVNVRLDSLNFHKSPCYIMLRERFLAQPCLTGPLEGSKVDL